MPVVTTYTTSEIKDYLLERTKHFQAEAVKAKGYIMPREGCPVPLEEAWGLYDQTLNFILLDILEATGVAFELRLLGKSYYPSLVKSIEDYWFFLEAVRYTVKALVDLFTRTK
jgi:hypothetical protein